MNEETSASGSTNVKRALRDSLAVLGLLLLVMCYVPPVEGWARHYEYVQAMQFLAFSVLVPALFVVGAPWRWLGLAASQPPRIDDDGLVQVDQSPRYVDRLVLARPHQVSNVRAIWVMVLFVALTIFWRSAPVVNFTVRHGWLVVLESLLLVPGVSSCRRTRYLRCGGSAIHRGRHVVPVGRRVPASRVLESRALAPVRGEPYRRVESNGAARENSRALARPCPSGSRV